MIIMKNNISFWLTHYSATIMCNDTCIYFNIVIL